MPYMDLVHFQIYGLPTPIPAGPHHFLLTHTHCDVRETQETPNLISLSSYFFNTASKLPHPPVAALWWVHLSCQIHTQTHLRHQHEAGRRESDGGEVKNGVYNESYDKGFCFVGGSTSIAGMYTETEMCIAEVGRSWAWARQHVHIYSVCVSVCIYCVKNFLALLDVGVCE